MKFSQRYGKTPSTKNIQLKSIDDELKNGLWNVVKIYVLNCVPKYEQYLNEPELKHLYTVLWHNYYKLPIDKIPNHDFLVEQFIRTNFYEINWFEIYDFIEFLLLLEYEFINKYEFVNAINSVLVREFSGYRVINRKIVPITNNLEITEIKESFDNTNYFTTIEGANIHLSNALSKLSDKKHHDYRNSIKESISAIETICRIITEESTLGNSLKKLETKGINIDKQLKEGIEKIYAYTNNKHSGIRHGIIEDHKNPDFNDAKYILVISSSFINYLVGKCIQLGISFNKI